MNTLLVWSSSYFHLNAFWLIYTSQKIIRKFKRKGFTHVDFKYIVSLIVQAIYLIDLHLCFQKRVFSRSQCRRGFLCVPSHAEYFQEQPTHTYKVAFSRRRQRYILSRLLWSHRLVSAVDEKLILFYCFTQQAVY